MTEQDARIIINRKLIEAGWKLEGHDRNVLTEQHCGAGFSDYLLLGRKGQNLGVLEAKDDNQGDVYLAKEQARGYALAMGCKYIFLANSEQLYFWDIDKGDARPIERFISPEDLQRRFDLNFLKKPLSQAEHQLQIADRPYQKKASDIIARLYNDGKRAFLLEMATGTGKTRLAAAIIDRFLKSHQAERVLFIVDMLSTGYDCPEILNIVLARPIASPTNYIQIKGRGTRRYTFSDGTPKTHFVIHDFCEVVEYFEEEYDFNAPLPAPVFEVPVGAEDKAEYSQKTRGEYKTEKSILVSHAPDALVMTEFIEVGPEGEKVDRMLYQNKWKEKIRAVAKIKPDLLEAAKTDNFTDQLMEYLNTEVLNRPVEYSNETNLAKVYRIFADITDFIKEALDIGKLPTPRQQMEALIDFLKVCCSAQQMHIRN